MSEFKREPRYIVFKIKDLEAYCSEQTRETALSIGDIIANGRRREEKAPFKAMVVEQDWPEFEPTWKAIERRLNPEFLAEADAFKGFRPPMASSYERILGRLGFKTKDYPFLPEKVQQAVDYAADLMNDLGSMRTRNLAAENAIEKIAKERDELEKLLRNIHRAFTEQAPQHALRVPEDVAPNLTVLEYIEDALHFNTANEE